MIKYIISFLIAISFNANANTIPYETMVGTKIEINEKLTEDFIRSNVKIINALKKCNTIDVDLINPTHGAISNYKILGKNSKNNCIIKYNFNSITEYNCALSIKDIKNIITSKEHSLKNLINLEIYTEVESKIYNNKKKCKAFDLKRKNKELSQNELDKIKKNNPNIGIIINSLNNKK